MVGHATADVTVLISDRPADVLAKTIQSSSGIVYELLKMLKSGKTDIDQWRIGLEGLLALRLFELPKEE